MTMKKRAVWCSGGAAVVPVAGFSGASLWCVLMLPAAPPPPQCSLRIFQRNADGK